MSRIKIDKVVERKLYAESMGRCMNPECQVELFINDGDMIEKAHIEAYCDTKDNAFDNLVILCPNCHTNYDKNHLFTETQIREWKRIRQEESERFFSKRFSSFNELKKEVVPLLLENKSYFENYYLTGQKKLWDKFEGRILVNNHKLKNLFENNLGVFQRHSNASYSNQKCIQDFISHVNEFEATRLEEEKHRQVLFPEKINSMFGIEPIDDSLLPCTETLEMFIGKLIIEGNFDHISIGNKNPYIQFKEDGEPTRVYLNDTPRLRQLYSDYKCPIMRKVRLESLNFVLGRIKAKGLRYEFVQEDNLREVLIKNHKVVFVYEYCLGKAALMALMPDENSIIVNLHNWNEVSCIAQDGYEQATLMNVTLMKMTEFYAFIDGLKNAK